MFQYKMTSTKAFISCSFDNNAKEINDYFTSIVKSCGFNPIILNNISAQPIPEKIKISIADSDLFIAIMATRPSDYVLNEIGMAYTLEKNIIVLKERSVTVSGIATGITDICVFDLQYYWMITPYLIQVLNILYQNIQSKYVAKDHLIRKYVKSIISIENSYIDNTTEIELVNLSDNLSGLNHGLIFYDEMESSLAEELDFRFDIYYPKIAYKLNKTRTQSSINFSVCFDPPLIQGQVLKYMYSQRITNYLPMTLSEISNRVKLGQHHLLENICDKNYTVSTPTELLDIQIFYPDKYEITKEQVVPTYYKANVELHDETRRISDNNYLKKEIFAGKTSLHLKLPFPKIFTRYSIRWVPNG